MSYQPLDNQQPYQPAVGQPYQPYQPPSAAYLAVNNQQQGYVPPGSGYVPPGSGYPSQSPYAPPPVNPSAPVNVAAVPNVPAGYVAVAVDSRYIQFQQNQAGSGQNPPGIPPNEWSDGFCDCCDDLGTCLMSFCCCCIRAALTIDRAQLLAFWKGLLLFLGLTVAVNVLTNLRDGDDKVWALPVAVVLAVIYAALRTYYRVKIREKYSIRGGAAEDCLLQVCCAPCAIAQEARHVDRCVGQLPINDRQQQR